MRHQPRDGGAACWAGGFCPGWWTGPLAGRWAGRLDVLAYLPALTGGGGQVSGGMYLAARTGTDD